ncbi:MAG: hypothetical protein ACP5P4_15805 [Steroidobacteraceae bacterium]
MSIVGAVLGWTGLPQWALELIAVGVVAAGAVGAFWLYHHHVYVEGIHAQQAADQRASAKVIAQARAETKAAVATAQAAHDAYIQEIAHEAVTAARHPLPAVRLCLDSYPGASSVPQAGAAHPGNAHPGPTPGGVPALHASGHRVRAGRGPDISGLLDLLARRADQVSAELREYQARNP